MAAGDFIGGLVGASMFGTVGWIWTTKIRAKHGYPLGNLWGGQVEPKLTSETVQRITLLDTDNARLRAELASLKDRLAVLERIATDRGGALSAEIERLRIVS